MLLRCEVSNLSREPLEELIKILLSIGVYEVMKIHVKKAAYEKGRSSRQSPRHHSKPKSKEKHQSEQKEKEKKQAQHILLILDYIPPRRADAPAVTLKKNVNYEIHLPPLSRYVWKKGNLIGKFLTMKYANFNLLEQGKYPKFHHDQYM